MLKELLQILFVSIAIASSCLAESDEANIMKQFIPLKSKGDEWICRVVNEHICQRDKCETKAAPELYIEADLRVPRYRLCSTKRDWIVAGVERECQDWSLSTTFVSGVHTVLLPIHSEGYLKILNNGSEFIAVTNFISLSNKIYFGNCARKS